MRMIRILALSVAAALLGLLALAVPAQAASSIRNMSVSPTCYTPGGYMTVYYQVRGNRWEHVVGGIVLSDDNDYEWNDDAVYTSSGAEDPPDSNGHNGQGMAWMGNPSAWSSETTVIRIPASYTGTKYVVVGTAIWFFQCFNWGNNVENDRDVVINPCVVAATPTRTTTPSITATSTRTIFGSPTRTTILTSTRTPTPTRTPVGVTAYQGIPPAERLYGLEYIPFPAMTNYLGTFRDLTFTANSLANNNVPRNTARYRIVLQNLNGQVQVETRIGPFGVTCTTGYFNSSAYVTATTLTLPSRPQNLSTTYAWVGSTVPVTERFSAVGDPRHTPYMDMLSLSNTAFIDGYNWFFKNMTVTTAAGFQDSHAGYSAFLLNADYTHYGFESWAGDPDSNAYSYGPSTDVPKLYRLWREGIYRTRSIMNSISGWSNYYLGLGGEIGGDSANKLAAGGVPMASGPYGSSGTGSRYDEIIDSTVMVRTSYWDSMPFLGELWPDRLYTSDWSSAGSMSSWGNLRNSGGGGGAAYRDEKEDITQTGRYSYARSLHINRPLGCASFMNGNDGTNAANTFNHSSIAPVDLAWLYDSQQMSNAYNFTMSNVFEVSRPWNLDTAGSASLVPPEWNLAPYSTSRTLLGAYSASTQTAVDSGFYQSSTVASSRRGSGTIRGLWNGMVGFFVISGLNTGTDTGINFVARFSLISCLRTFHDAGAPALSSAGVYNGKTMVTNRNVISGTSYRMEPIPYVAISKPTDNEDKRGQGFIRITWNERYARWDGKRYTESYPCVDDTDPNSAVCQPAVPASPGNPAIEWHSLTGTALVYNLKYSSDNGDNWYSCISDTQAEAGTYLPAGDSLPGDNTYTYNYTWDITALSAGTKLLRVECYKASNPEQHYAFHEIHVVIDP